MSVFGDKPVVITMLGSRGSGKTCFMSAMYAMMAAGQELKGYCLEAEKQADARALLTFWEKMLRTTQSEDGANRFPPSTSATTDYSFLLNYGFGEPVIRFDWQDYRGGLIPADDDEPNRQKLIDRLKVTDCLMICVSGEHLSKKLTPETKPLVLLDIDLNFINQLVSQIQRSGHNIPPSVVIVITKYDYCKEREMDLFEDVKEIFQVFFEAKGWLVMMCPVSLGLGLSKNISSPLTPLNIHIPVVFSLLSKMIRIQWEKLDPILSKVRSDDGLESGQKIAGIRQVFRQIQDSPSVSGDQDSELAVAEKLKGEVLRMSSIILNDCKKDDVPPGSQFHIYLNGEKLTWRKILGLD